MKKNLSLFVLSLLAGAGVFLTGCATDHDTGAYVPINTMINDVENHEVVVLLDPRVQYSVTCPGIQERTTPDGRMEVVAQIRNRENRRLQVQINCVFKDDQGFPTEGDETPFRTLILSENAQETASFSSLNNKARHFTIRIREAH
jgi:uncharacterized protein YcfL